MIYILPLYTLTSLGWWGPSNSDLKYFTHLMLHEIFELCFYHKWVVPVPSPLIHTLKYFHHLLRFHWVIGPLKNICVHKHINFWISVYQYTDIFESPCIETRRLKYFGVFWISVYWNTEIRKYEQFCLTKPQCFKTRRFLNLRELKYGDSKIFMFKPWRFFNLHVLKHGDFWISMYWNMEIQNLHVLEHGN